MTDDLGTVSQEKGKRESMVCQQGWEHGAGSGSGGLDLKLKLERWQGSIWKVRGSHAEGYLLP